MINRQLQAYKENEVNTASKIKLVIMMYDGSIRFLKECKKKMRENDIAGRGLYISKAQRVISELQVSLNRRKGGEVAENLEKLYSLLISKLTYANIKGDGELIDQSLEILESLRMAWDTVIKENVTPLKSFGKTPSGEPLNL